MQITCDIKTRTVINEPQFVPDVDEDGVTVYNLNNSRFKNIYVEVSLLHNDKQLVVFSWSSYLIPATELTPARQAELERQAIKETLGI